MSEETPDNSIDVLGLKPLAESINKVTGTTVDGAAAFLRLICRPAAEEFGLMMRDRIKVWRAVNIVKTTQKAEAKFKQMGVPHSVTAHPRLVSRILEEASWVEEDDLQEMWAGLLTSSCSEDGKDDSNLIFTHYLSQMTTLQAKILNYGCIHSKKYLQSDRGIIALGPLVSIQQIKDIFAEEDENRLETEFAHLHGLGLLHHVLGGRNEEFPTRISPTILGHHLYIRCQGATCSPADYFETLDPTAQASE